MTKIIRGTSKRTGAIFWVRQDGTPSDHQTEAGRFREAAAHIVIADYTATLVRVVGRCAVKFDILDEDHMETRR